MPTTCEGYNSLNQIYGQSEANFTYCSLVNGDRCQSYVHDFSYSFDSPSNKTVVFKDNF